VGILNTIVQWVIGGLKPKTTPDFSVRPVVIRGSSLKRGLFVLAFGIGAGLFGVWTWGSDDFSWISFVTAGLLCPLGLWAIMSGPQTIQIGDDTVRLADKKTWWSLPQTCEWPISEFKCVRLVHTISEGENYFDVKLEHADDREITLLFGDQDEDYAYWYADRLARALNLPMESSKPSE